MAKKNEDDLTVDDLTGADIVGAIVELSSTVRRLSLVVRLDEKDRAELTRLEDAVKDAKAALSIFEKDHDL